MPIPILSDSERRPIFPEGWVGSLSHSGSFVFGGLSSSNRFSRIGIDIEKTRFNKISFDLARVPRVLHLTELEWFKANAKNSFFCQHSHSFSMFLTCVASMKEALYKSLSISEQMKSSWKSWRMTSFESTGLTLNAKFMRESDSVEREVYSEYFSQEKGFFISVSAY